MTEYNRKWKVLSDRTSLTFSLFFDLPVSYNITVALSTQDTFNMYELFPPDWNTTTGTDGTANAADDVFSNGDTGAAQQVAQEVADAVEDRNCTLLNTCPQQGIDKSDYTDTEIAKIRVLQNVMNNIAKVLVPDEYAVTDLQINIHPSIDQQYVQAGNGRRTNIP